MNRSDDAVSPVIGVILMVAVTVILAAVVGASAFGMSGGVTKPRLVACTAQLSDTTIIVTYQGGPGHNEVDHLTAQWSSATDSSQEATNLLQDADTSLEAANGITDPGSLPIVRQMAAANRLTTGQRINTAADDPAGLSVSGNFDTNFPADAPPAVGAVAVADVTGVDGPFHVVVVATFTDGMSQVVLDTTVGGPPSADSQEQQQVLSLFR